MRTARHPFTPGQDWLGTYTCAQGLTSVDLRIVSTHCDVIDDAQFIFDWQTGGVTGSYHMTGTFDPNSGTATFTPAGWIIDPNGMGNLSSHMVGMSGSVSGNTYAGNITDGACGSFSVTN